MRLKHGRKRVIQSPKALWENAIQYFEWCTDNPLLETEQAKSTAKPAKNDDGNIVFPPNTIHLPKMRAFTKGGLALACGLNAWEEIHNLKTVSKDFSEVITRIETAIYEQKFTGAAAGFLNPNIIARDLGLLEKTETNLKGGAFSFNLVMGEPEAENDPIP